MAPLETVVEDAPSSLQARYLLGLCYFFTERYAEAAKTLRGIEGMEVLETSATVDGEKIKEYHTHVRIKFRIER